MGLIIPKDYQSKLNNFETQQAIKLVKDTFQKNLATKLNLLRVSAPLFVDPLTGLNDNLSGKETAVNFKMAANDTKLEIVHSLAKWKRMALQKYDIPPYMGLYTDMNAIRPEEELGNLHSIYVDQWDWEQHILQESRNMDYLKDIVIKINDSIIETIKTVQKAFPILDLDLSEEVYFITSEELLQMYPTLEPKEREERIAKEKKTVFILQIGHDLSNGIPHDVRSPDYDDWDLNGDLIVYYPILDCAIELSSMGIRVDQESLKSQLKVANKEERLTLEYHQAVLNNHLPLTIGGGIGQSRLCMIFLEKAHIGEVQVSVWPEEDIEILKQNNIYIL